MKSKLLILIQLFLITIHSANAQKVNQNLNISILLDLSDRIDPNKNPGFYQRDLQHIKSIESTFLDHIKTKRALLLNDQMQVFFDPIPNIENIDALSKLLKVSFNARTNRKDILNLDKTYSDIPAKIYKNAIKSNYYIGSDIWRFFKNNVQTYCLKPQHRNILVIFTDGYMYHDNSKILQGGKSSYITSDFIRKQKLVTNNYLSIMKKNSVGLITFPHNLSELEVVVIGINPSNKNPYEEDVIKQYWSDWFKSMKVKKFYLLTTDLPANLDPVINKIILK